MTVVVIVTVCAATDAATARTAAKCAAGAILEVVFCACRLECVVDIASSKLRNLVISTSKDGPARRRFDGKCLALEHRIEVKKHASLKNL